MNDTELNDALVMTHARALTTKRGRLTERQYNVCVVSLALLPARAGETGLEILRIWLSPEAGGYTLRQLGGAAIADIKRTHEARAQAWANLIAMARAVERAQGEGSAPVGRMIYYRMDMEDAAAKDAGQFLPPIPPRFPAYDHLHYLRREYVRIYGRRRALDSLPDIRAVDAALQELHP